MATTLNTGNFVETKQKVRVTLSGWDGKSYNGEGRDLKVWTNDAIPGKQFVMVPFRGRSWDGKAYRVACFHEVTDERHAVSGEIRAEYYTSID